MTQLVGFVGTLDGSRSSINFRETDCKCPGMQGLHVAWRR